MQSSAAPCDVLVSVAAVQAGGEIGADGGTNADIAGRDMHAPAAARARVAAADLVDVEEAIFAKFVEENDAMSRCGAVRH